MIANFATSWPRSSCSAWRRRRAADVITDWNEKAVAFVLARGMGPPPAERLIAMVHVAMFDAVNRSSASTSRISSDLPAVPGRLDGCAAAAAAAGTVLAALSPQCSPR